MNKFIKLSVFSSVLCAQAANFGCMGGEKTPAEPIVYDTQEIREKMYPLFTDMLVDNLPDDVKQNMEKEYAALAEKYKGVKPDIDEESLKKTIAQAEQAILDLHKKYAPMPADFFETASPTLIMDVFINSGNNLTNVFTPEELFFWFYVERMRYMMLASLHADLSFGEESWIIEEFTEGVKQNLKTDDPKITSDIFEDIIRYEKQKPFNFKKYKEGALRFAGEDEDNPLKNISEEDFAKARQKVLEIFEGDLKILRALKPGQSFEDAVAEENAKNGIVEYELGLTMHPLYPIQPFFTVLYLDEEGKRAAEVFPLPNNVWGYPAGGSSHISAGGARPLPRKLDMVYYSVVENKAYSLEEILPYEKLKEMFSKKDADGGPLYTDIIIGAAPYGGVALWTQRSDTRQTELIAWLKGKEVALDFADFASSALIAGSDWDEFRTNVLQENKEAAENLKENGLPDKELFNQFNKKYNTAFNVRFNAPAENGGSTPEAESFTVRYFNGENETLTPADFGKAAMRAKPKEIEISFKDGKNENTSYLYVSYKTAADNRASEEAYMQAFSASPEAEGEINFTFNGIKEPWDIKVSSGENTALLPFEEIRFRNKFEVYRTPVYYQPHSFWKGEKPQAEEAAVPLPKEALNLLDSDGETPLFKAVRTYDENTFKALLTAGADVNLKTEAGDTPLALAASTGNFDFLKALIAAGADVNMTDSSGKTPLMLASFEGNEKIVKLLLEAGADVNVSWLVNGLDSGMTALSLALENGNTAVAEILREHGAVEAATSPVDFEPQPLPSAENVNTPDAAGFTPLFHALMAGDNERLEAIISLGADVNVKAPAVGTPLLFACTSGNLEAAKSLIRAKADLNTVGDTGYTPLMMAAQTGNKELVALLLEAGADFNAPLIINGQDTGLNALKIAETGGFEDVAAILKGAGAKE
ncbi:MAG: DUF2931 family protein [Elusimicrobiaceae bacterium]